MEREKTIVNGLEPATRLSLDQYRIIEYLVKDFRIVQLIHLALDKDQRLVMFTGKNGAGKTTAIDALAHALGAAPWQSEIPQRRGAAEPYEIKLTLQGEKRLLIITYTPKKKLQLKVVENGKETTVDSPFGVIKEIVDPLAFDPLTFIRLKPTEQVERLQNTLHITEIIDELKAQKEADEALRKDLNAAIKGLQAMVSSYVVQDLPAEKHDLEKLRRAIEEAEAHNATLAQQMVERTRLKAALETAQANRDRNQKLIEATRVDIVAAEENISAAEPNQKQAEEILDSLRKVTEDVRALTDGPVSAVELAHKQMDSYTIRHAQNLDQWRATLKRDRQVLKAAEHQVEALEQAVTAAQQNYDQAPAGELIPTGPLRKALEDAELENRAIDKRSVHEQNQADLKAKYAEREPIQQRIDSFESRRNEAVAAAIENATKTGLLPEKVSFTTEAVFYDGLPLQQWGQAEQLRVTITLALASKPQLRLICIPEGGAFDDESLLALQKMAVELNFYVFMARWDQSGEVGIVLENGRVKANNKRLFRAQEEAPEHEPVNEDHG